MSGSEIERAIADIAYHLHIGPSHFMGMRVGYFVTHYKHLIRISQDENEKIKKQREQQKKQSGVRRWRRGRS